MIDLKTPRAIALATLALCLSGCPDSGEGETPTAPLAEATPTPEASPSPSEPTGTLTPTPSPTPTPTPTATPWPDRDGDGAGEDVDCDDADPLNFPDNIEDCDGIDNDCDFSADEGLTQLFYADEDGDGAGDANAPLPACEAPEGYVDDTSDCDDTNSAAHPGGDETCDGADNDCDGGIDEGVSTLYYADADGDGVGDAATTQAACAQLEGYVEGSGDCDDADAGNAPGLEEVCDGGDNDCDFSADEGALTTYYGDADLDGFGNVDSPQPSCAQPEGTVTNAQDCDDLDADKSPTGVEVCDLKDNDCDNSIDEAVKLQFWPDTDGDGAGDAAITSYACALPDGHVANDDDCDDDDRDNFAGNIEVCDAGDNDCDEGIDEEAVDPGTYYADLDGDTYGAPDVSTTACEAPAGYVEDASDCDDEDSALNPAALEICDNLDDNCDGGLIPCTADVDFSAAEDRDLFIKEGSSSCSDPGVIDGALVTDCPDNVDTVFWLDFDCPEASRIFVSVDLFVGAYYDAGPRDGIDIGTGVSPWGPTSGYAFHMSDPHDGTQGGLCTQADTCPSITLNGDQSIAVLNERSAANTLYHFEVLLDDAGEVMGLSFPVGQQGEASFELAVDDKSVRSGRIGLHCSESPCAFDNLHLEVD